MYGCKISQSCIPFAISAFFYYFRFSFFFSSFLRKIFFFSTDKGQKQN